jgi:NitT/TauT family transport system permease protein
VLLSVTATRIALICFIFIMWQAIVSAGYIDAFWISSPLQVAHELWRLAVSGEILGDVAITLAEAVIAFVLSSVLGIATGLVLARSPFWDEVLAPIIVVLNSLPRVALAPLIILWCGVGITAKVVTAFTLVYFILLVNTLAGAKNVDNDILTIARLMGASPRTLLWKVILPSATPWIFAGLNLGLTYSLLGVIVAEILASNQGLGFLIASAAGNFNTAGVFAGLIVLAALSWIMTWVMRMAEARLLRWKPSVSSA